MYNGSYAVKVKPIKTVEYKYPMIQFLYYNSQLFNEAELCRLRRMLISLAEVLKTLPSNRPLPLSSFFRPKSEKSLKKPIQKLRVQPLFFFLFFLLALSFSFFSSFADVIFEPTVSCLLAIFHSNGCRFG